VGAWLARYAGALLSAFWGKAGKFRGTYFSGFAFNFLLMPV